MTSTSWRYLQSLLVGTFAFTALLCAPPTALGQDSAPQAGRVPPPRSTRGISEGPTYDVGQETAIRGTVVEVKTGGAHRAAWFMHGPGLAFGRRRGAAQQPLVVLRTDTGTLIVHAGPKPFLEAQRIELHKGDEIDVIGAPVSLHGTSVILAREIARADQTWTIRDATGRPLWSGEDFEPRRSKKMAVLAFATKAPLILLLVRVLA